MKTPVAWVPADDRVAAATRQKRDAYFDKLIGFPEKLTAKNAGSMGTTGDHFGVTEEIPKLPDRAIAIGIFARYQPVLSASGRSVYTEVVFSVSKLLESPAGGSDAPDITLVFPGGTVKTEAGEIISFLTWLPKPYFVEVGRQYLLVMSYKAGGGFYSLAESWDLSNGSARPNFGHRTRTQALTGLSVEKVPDKVAAMIGKTTLDRTLPEPPGIFTAAQAEAGRIVSEKSCSQCHTPSLLGRTGQPGELPALSLLTPYYRDFIGPRGYVPPLAGKAFVDKWGYKTAAQLISRFDETVDFFKPQGMDNDTAVNVTAYILQMNGARAGNRPLTRTTDVVASTVMRVP